MKKTGKPEFKVKSEHWIGSEVYTLTSYGLPVRLKIDGVNVIINDKNEGVVLGFFSNNYRLLPKNLISEETRNMAYPGILDIPDIADYITYEVAKAFKKNKKFVKEYEATFILPYSKLEENNNEE